jgi:protein phosphatase
LEASQDRLDVTWPFGYDFGWSIEANRLITAVRLANKMVWRRSEQAAEHAGMGTTVAAALVQANCSVLANVGDSRIYRFRRGQFQQLSVDDTLVANLVAQGLLPEDEIGAHPLRNVLTQAAGAQEDVTVHVIEEASESGDCLMICSDGLYGVVPNDAVCSILATGMHACDCAHRLMEQALKAGAPDNIAIVLLRYI